MCEAYGHTEFMYYCDWCKVTRRKTYSRILEQRNALSRFSSAVREATHIRNSFYSTIWPRQAVTESTGPGSMVPGSTGPGFIVPGSTVIYINIADETAICSICLDTMIKRVVQKFACSHIFHMECIARWLEWHNTCPYCRANLYP